MAWMKISPGLLGGAASDLLHPVSIRMSADPGYVHPSAFQMEKEQYVISHQPSPTQHFNGEEITPGEHAHVSSEKVLSGCDLAPFGSRGDAVPTQYVFHRLIRQPMTQVGQRTDDPVIAPAGVLPRHSDHQGF